MAEEIHPLDDPEKKARTVRALLIATPCMFVGCYILAWAQGAEVRHAVLIAAVGAIGCAGTALTIHLFGSKSRYALVLLGLVSLIMRLR
jgi:multidrug efflux pump subunit AcrB